MPLNLGSALKDKAIAMETWPLDAGAELKSLLTNLGVPGRTTVHAEESDRTEKPRVLVNGLVQDYSLELVKTVTGYFSPQLTPADLDTSGSIRLLVRLVSMSFNNFSRSWSWRS